jgi:hypothetical protein
MHPLQRQRVHASPPRLSSLRCQQRCAQRSVCVCVCEKMGSSTLQTHQIQSCCCLGSGFEVADQTLATTRGACWYCPPSTTPPGVAYCLCRRPNTCWGCFPRGTHQARVGLTFILNGVGTAMVVKRKPRNKGKSHRMHTCQCRMCSLCSSVPRRVAFDPFGWIDGDPPCMYACPTQRTHATCGSGRRVTQHGAGLSETFPFNSAFLKVGMAMLLHTVWQLPLAEAGLCGGGDGSLHCYTGDGPESTDHPANVQ